MNLLIVDDEPKIRRGLHRYLSNTDLEFDIVETAETGLIALEKARKIRPDIILADICMPKMDGLEFIEKISRELEDAKVIIISGHDDFSYAQKALRYGVEEYVLKPIDLHQLYGLLKRTYNKILSEKDKKDHFRFALDSVQNNKDALASQLFAQLVNGQIRSDETENIARYIGFSIPEHASLMIIRVLDRLAESSVEWERSLLCYAVDNIVREMCSGMENALFFNDSRHNIIVLSSYCEDVDYISFQEEICKTIENCVKYTAKSDVAFLTDTCVNFQNVYKQMVHYLSNINEYSLIVVEAKKYIQHNYHREDLSLHAVAKAIQVNPSYLSRLMHQQLGMSFIDYLTDVRMKKAAIVLSSCEKDIKLYEISQKLGYSSQHYFSRVFSKYYGKSPLQFRSKEGEKN